LRVNVPGENKRLRKPNGKKNNLETRRTSVALKDTKHNSHLDIFHQMLSYFYF